MKIRKFFFINFLDLFNFLDILDNYFLKRKNGDWGRVGIMAYEDS